MLMLRDRPQAEQLDMFVHFNIAVHDRDCFKADMFDRVEKIEKSQDKQRRALFAKLGEINKVVSSIDQRMAYIEEGICKTSLKVKEG